MVWLWTTTLFSLSAKIQSVESDLFAKVAFNYARAMVDWGRDRYGPESSPLFAAQMIRQNYTVPLEPHAVFPPMDSFGLRYDDRAWGSANGQDHVELYQLLYALGADRLDASYSNAASKALQYTFRHLRSAKTDLIAWGEECSWMLHYEAPRLPGDGIMDGVFHSHAYDNDIHEPSARLSSALWDKIFVLEPEGARAFVLGLWNHQISDHQTGDFTRHARFTSHGPGTEASFPRLGSWMMMAWAKGYQHVPNKSYRETMLKAMHTIADSYLRRRHPETGVLPAGTGERYGNVYWSIVNLMMAADFGQLLDNGILPEDLHRKLDNLASGCDSVFLTKLQHNLDGHLPGQPIGFHFRAVADRVDANGKLEIGDPRGAKKNDFSDFWTAGYGSPMTSSIALLAFERSDQLGDTEAGRHYRQLALQAAELYLGQMPDRNPALHPIALADAIECLLQAFRHNHDPRFLEKAIAFGHEAAALFFDATSALPKVTSRHDFYEAITGGDNLALALYHLTLADTSRNH